MPQANLDQSIGESGDETPEAVLNAPLAMIWALKGDEHS